MTGTGDRRIVRGVGALATLLLVAAGQARLARAEADSFGVGSGRDGALDVASGTTSIGNYAALTAGAAAGATSLTVDSTAGFAPGQLVMIWQTTGLASATSGSQTAIDLATAGVGHYELGRLKSAAGTSLTVTNPLVASYTSDAQVSRVFEYTTVTIAAGASLAPAQSWNGDKGGVLAFLATGAVSNAGTIQANGAGFRGGLLRNHGTLNGCTALDGTPPMGLGPKGEGIVPSQYSATSSATSISGRGNVANAGGGGDCHNSGGGGGGHIGVGGLGGKTVNVDLNRNVGGLGGAPLVYTMTARLSFGGGGGAGDENNNVGTAGAAGGGLVFIRAASLSGAGTISANGASPPTVAANDGAGGGGAGGAVVLRVQGAAACAALEAKGGDGGNTAYLVADPHGPGGGGGGGAILFQAASGSCPTSVLAGQKGLYQGLDHGAGPAAPTTPASVGLVTTLSGGYSGGVCTPAVIAVNQCGGCVANGDCPAAMGICDGATNFCHQCLNDAHCAASPNGPLCDLGKRTCGTCTAANQVACTGTTPRCNTAGANNVCTACNGNFASGAAFACLSSAAPICAMSGPKAGACVVCVDNTQCSGNTPICNTTTNVCAACNGNFGSGSTLACPSSLAPACVLSGPQTGVCVVCVDNTQCSGNTPICNTTTNVCAACNGNFGSGSTLACPSSLAPACVLSGPQAGKCVVCIDNTQCSGNAPICNTTTSVCAACNGNFGSGSALACPSSLAPACVLSGVQAGKCVVCVDNTQCSGNTPICNTTTNVCGACNGNFGSGSALACPSSLAPACVLSGAQMGKCVVCVDNTQCSGNTPICNTTTNGCDACNGNFGSGSALACPSSSAPACVLSGAQMGRCVVCVDNTQCSGNAPICNTAINLCAACTRNFGSAGGLACPMSTPFCNVSTGACSVNCMSDSDCTEGSWCNNVTTAGTCGPRLPNGQPVPGGTCSVMLGMRACESGICHTDGLCGLPIGAGTCTGVQQCRAGSCALSGPSSGTCVECVSDASCTGARPVCNPTTNACVECSATNDTRCAGMTPVCNIGTSSCASCTSDNGSGATLPCPLAAAPLCRPSGACDRCQANADCLVGTHAGAICNVASGVCGTSCTTDADCGARWCDNPSAMSGQGTCTTKVDNGQPLPASPPISGTCSAANAARVCVSARCETTDNRCGLQNGSDCASATVCRSAICAADGKCGSPNGDPCMSASTCRSGICAVDGRCGRRDGEPCSQVPECRTPACTTGRCGLPPDAAPPPPDTPPDTPPPPDAPGDPAAGPADTTPVTDAGPPDAAPPDSAVAPPGDARPDAAADRPAADRPDAAPPEEDAGHPARVQFGGGGCACAVADPGHAPNGAWALLLVAGAALCRRRRFQSRPSVSPGQGT